MRAIVSVLLFALGCGSAEVRPSPPPAPPPDIALEDAVFPASDIEELRVDFWGRHVALAADGHIYGSNGDDLPTMIGPAAIGLLLHERGPETLDCAVLGLGTGTEATALAALGCRRIDVYERRDEYFERARALGPWFDDRLRPSSVEAPFRVLRELPSPAPRYDIVVQCVAATVLVRPHRLFTVERFERLSELLAEGGIFVQHVQLYEVQRETHQRLVRTFAEAFPHAVAYGPEQLSSDSLLFGSDRPIAIDLRRAELAAARAPSFLEGMHSSSPYDWLARVLFASREELIEYADRAGPYTLSEPMRAGEMPLRPPNVPPAEWDEDFEERYQRQMDAYTAQFPEGFVESFYGDDARFGDVCSTRLEDCAFVRAMPAEAPLADLALSYAAHQRLEHSLRVVERARADGADVFPAAEVLADLASDEAVDFDPLDPFPPGFSPDVETAMSRIWARRFGEGVMSELQYYLTEIRPEHEGFPHLLSAIAIAYELDGDMYEARGRWRTIAEEHAAWCDAHPPCWRAMGRAELNSDETERAVTAFARHHRTTRPR
jgi:hypothetical protein